MDVEKPVIIMTKNIDYDKLQADLCKMLQINPVGVEHDWLKTVLTEDNYDYDAKTTLICTFFGKYTYNKKVLNLLYKELRSE